MSDKKLGIILDVTANNAGFDEVNRELKGVEGTGKEVAQNLSGSWEESMTKIRNISAIAFAATAAGIGLAVREAAQGEQSMANFRASVHNAGGDADILADRLNDTAMQLQRLTGIADDEFVEAAARMTDITGNASDSIDKLGMVADLAVARSIPLATASDAVARAMEGEIGALARIMPGLDDQIRALGDTATNADKAAVIFDRLAQFQGRAAEAANTTTGKINVMNQEVAAVTENLGNAFLPAVKSIVESLTPLIRDLGEWASKHEDLVKVIGGGTLVVTGFLGTLAIIGLTIPTVVTGIETLKTAMLALKATNPEWLLFAALVLGVGAAWEYTLDAASASGATAAQLGTLSEELGMSVDELQRIRNNISGWGEWGSDEEARWQGLIAVFRGMKEPAEQATKVVEGLSLANIASAEKASLNADALRDLMNAGLDFATAMQLAQGAVMPTQDVTADTTRDPWEAYGISQADWESMTSTRAQAWLALQEQIRAEGDTTRDKEKARMEQQQQDFLRHTQFLSSTYQQAVGIMLNEDMTGKQKREAIWNAMKASFTQKIAQMTSDWIFGELAKQTVTQTTTAIGVTASNTYTATETANAATRQGSYMAAAYGKLVEFYSWSGPLAPVLAVGTIVAAIAGIGAVIGAATGAMKFQRGGLVPGQGFGDKVFGLLEPGEYVVRRDVAMQNYGVLQAMNNGRALGGGNNVSVALHMDGEGISLQRKIEIRDLIEEVIPDAIKRALDDRRLSPSFA